MLNIHINSEGFWRWYTAFTITGFLEFVHCLVIWKEHISKTSQSTYHNFTLKSPVEIFFSLSTPVEIMRMIFHMERELCISQLVVKLVMLCLTLWPKWLKSWSQLCTVVSFLHLILRCVIVYYYVESSVAQIQKSATGYNLKPVQSSTDYCLCSHFSVKPFQCCLHCFARGLPIKITFACLV
jgi:hypothetical protein